VKRGWASRWNTVYLKPTQIWRAGGEVALDKRQLLILIRKWKDNSIRILKREMSCGE
jgi:hypothetical protein